MHTLSLNTLIRPAVSLGVLLELLGRAPGRRIWIKDTMGRYTYANAAWAADAGGEILGRIDADLPWADRAIEYAAADALAGEGALVVRGERVRVAGGGEVEGAATKLPLLGASGELVGTLGVLDPVPAADSGPPARRCEECAAAAREAVRAGLVRLSALEHAVPTCAARAPE